MALYCTGIAIFKAVQPALLRAGWSHLPERKGLVAGCIISGCGFGSMIFGEIAQMVANPGGEYKYEVDPLDGELYLPKQVGDNFG